MNSAREVAPHGSPTGQLIALACICGNVHPLATEIANEHGQLWSFNGDTNSPSFYPSMPCGAYVIEGYAFQPGSGAPLPELPIE